MATNFPTSLDNSTSLPYPSTTDDTNSPSLAGGQDNQNDAVIATQTKLGTGASTPSGSNLLVSTGTGTSAWSKAAPTGTIIGTTDTQTLTNKTLTAPTITAPSISNPTITGTLGNTTVGTLTATGLITGNAGGTFASNLTLNSGTLTLPNNVVTASMLATNAITLGYAQITSLFSTSSTTDTQVTGLSVTVTIPAGGRPIKITAYGGGAVSNTSAAINSLSIWDGAVHTGTELQLGQTATASGGTGSNSITPIAVVTPTAGSKTYNVGLSATAGTVTINASSVFPAFILVEAI